MKIRAVIADDEKPAREELKYLLGSFDDVEVAGEAVDGPDAVEKVKRLVPDALFLDIQMPGLGGFAVLENLLAGGKMPHVVFTTAYDEYAVHAFEVNAVDYLLKPFDRERLARAVEKLAARLEGRPGTSPDLEKLLRILRQGRKEMPRISVRKGKRLLLIDTETIVYAHIQDGVVFVVTPQFEGIVNYRTLDDLAEDLPADSFLKVHRSYVVNIRKVTEIVPWFSGGYKLRLSLEKGKEIPVSRSQVKKLKEMLKF
jgi:two-component system response regulator LytT